MRQQRGPRGHRDLQVCRQVFDALTYALAELDDPVIDDLVLVSVTPDHRHARRDPDDPPDPQAGRHVVRFELAAETFALLRQARMVLNDEHGTNLDDDAFVATLCNAVLDGTSAGETTGRAKFQIAVTVCQRCRKGWQEGAGAQIAIDAEAVDRALCDAQHIGSIDGAAPERAHQDIPPSVARFVWRRDGGRCRVPGCRSARGLELHHLVHRADGGSHDAMNLALICSSCHLAHHRGALTITGTADQLAVHRPGQAVSEIEAYEASPANVRPSNTGTIASGDASAMATTTAMAVATPDAHMGSIAGSEANTVAATTDIAKPGAHVDATDGATAATEPAVHRPAARTRLVIIDEPSIPVRPTRNLDAAILRTQAKEALTGLGWKPAIAHAAVSAAAASQQTEMTLEQLIFESLRRCPVPKT